MDPILIQVFVVMLVVGAFAGVLAGLLGVGGGIVLVPVFFYVFKTLGYGGPDIMQVCLATSLATIIVTSARSLSGHHKKGAVDWDILRAWAPGIAVGAVIGLLVAARLPSVALQLIFGVLGAVIGGYMLFGKKDWTLSPALPASPLKEVWASAIGLLSVLLGIGGGSLGVPFMTLCSVPIHRAVATAAGFGLAISIPSVIGWFFVTPSGELPPFTFGAVNLLAFAVIVPMTFLTAPFGVRLAHRLDPGPLKRVFGVFLTLVALNMAREAFFG